MVIPTLNAAEELSSLLERLASQSRSLEEIVVVDSSSDDETCAIAERHPSVKVIEIARTDFNHGLTRDLALRETSGDVVCFLTQDAMPVDNFYIENLVAPIEADPKIALVSGRQLPKKDARRFEQLVRAYNYPAHSNVRTIDDLPRLGIKAYFASDVCSAYRRQAYLSVGGFDEVKTNEDMLMAARLLKAGYKVAYSAEAEVFHSHNLTAEEQYRRNRVVGEFLSEYGDELAIPDEIGEGSRLVKSVLNTLLKEGRAGEAVSFLADCAARYVGNRVGRMDAAKRGNQ